MQATDFVWIILALLFAVALYLTLSNRHIVPDAKGKQATREASATQEQARRIRQANANNLAKSQAASATAKSGVRQGTSRTHDDDHERRMQENYFKAWQQPFPASDSQDLSPRSHDISACSASSHDRHDSGSSSWDSSSSCDSSSSSSD